MSAEIEEEKNQLKEQIQKQEKLTTALDQMEFTLQQISNAKMQSKGESEEAKKD